MRFPLALLWFVYMAAAGAFYPYYGLYLRQGLSFSAAQVGLVIAVMPLIGLFSQPTWGYLADLSGSRRRTLAGAMVGVALGCGLLASAQNFPTVLLATALFAASATAVIPMTTALTMGALPNGAQGFGPVRMWGTLGYGAMVLGLPILTTRLAGQEQDRLWVIFPATGLLALLAAFCVSQIADAPGLRQRAAAGDLRRLLRHPPLRRLLVTAFLSHLCMQGPINLFPLLLAERGGTVEDLRSAWLWMLALEVPLVGFASTALRRLGPRGLLVFGLSCEALRWSAVAWIDDLETLKLLQILHGCSAMGVLLGIPLYIDQAVPERLRATGQTLISACGLGIGSMASIAGGGWLYDHWASRAPFAGGGLVALALAASLFLLLPAPYKPAD